MLKRKYTLNHALGTSVFTGGVLAAWGCLIGIGVSEAGQVYQTAKQVPTLQRTNAALTANQLPAGSVAVSQAVFEQTLAKPLPSLSDLDQAVIVIAIHAEASGESTLGQQAVAATILNRIGSHALTAAEVVRANMQFSFTAGDSVGAKLLRQKSQHEVIAYAKTLAKEQQALQGIIVKHTHYIDVVGNRTYYFNPKTSDTRGKNFMATLRDPLKIGNHIFLRAPNGKV